jgi:outer membrane biosynthesis protein TonB
MLRAVSATVAAVGVALAVGLGTVEAASAESPTSDPTPTACESCEQPTATPGAKEEKPDPKPTQEPAPAQPEVPDPGPPAKQVPAAPAAPAPAPEPTLAPEPVAPAEETATAEATTASPSPTATTAGPSTESNWNKPITKSATPTQAAAISDGGDDARTGLLPITAGVLLVGLGGLSFVWWGRNRISAH